MKKEKKENIEQLDTEKQLDTVTACIKMPVSHKCGCIKKLDYNPASIVCKKCVLADRFINPFTSDILKALSENDLEKVINIISEVI